MPSRKLWAAALLDREPAAGGASGARDDISLTGLPAALARVAGKLKTEPDVAPKRNFRTATAH